MISFAPTETESAAQAMLQEVARNDLRPAASRFDDAGAVPAHILDGLWALGLIQAQFDGRSRILGCIVLEELAWADAALAVALGAAAGVSQSIIDHGSPAQRARAQADAAQSNFRPAAVLIQEPGFAFDPAALKTEAVKTADGYVLSGVKSMVPLAAACREFLVLARCEGGVQAFIVPADASGVAAQAPKGTLGLKSLALADVRFDQVALPAAARLGEAAGCDAIALLSASRAGLCAILTGLARAAFEHITPYTKDRVAHGSALARKQSVAFRLADMVIDTPAMRWMTWRAAAALQHGRPALREARLAQIHCAEKAVAITDEAIQLMGGHGYMRASPVERWYRDAQTLALLDGVVGV